jgi:hypothetical protein
MTCDPKAVPKWDRRGHLDQLRVAPATTRYRPGGGRTSIEARRVWESLIAALAGDCHSVDEVFKLLEVSWPDAKNWSTFCESRLLVRALAAYSARGWLAGSVSGVEFEGQSGWVR